MTAPIDVVLAAAERLAPVRKSGINWNTNCPAHPDKNPSLSISEGRNGNVVIAQKQKPRSKRRRVASFSVN